MNALSETDIVRNPFAAGPNEVIEVREVRLRDDPRPRCRRRRGDSRPTGPRPGASRAEFLRQRRPQFA